MTTTTDFIFIENHDQMNCDLNFIRQCSSIDYLKQQSINKGDRCCGFNDVGFLKMHINNLEKTNKTKGIYLKKHLFKYEKDSYETVITYYKKNSQDLLKNRWYKKFSNDKKNMIIIFSSENEEIDETIRYDKNVSIFYISENEEEEIDTTNDHLTLNKIVDVCNDYISQKKHENIKEIIGNILFVPLNTFFLEEEKDYLFHSDIVSVRDVLEKNIVIKESPFNKSLSSQKLVPYSVSGNIIITGLCQNIEKWWKTTLKTFLKILFNTFEKSPHLILFENGSTDKTKNILLKFKNIFSDSITIINSEKVSEIQPREKRLSAIRNLLLNYTKRNFPDTKYYITLDTDDVIKYFYGLSNVFDDFGYDWDAQFPITNGKYYDIYALRNEYVTENFLNNSNGGWKQNFEKIRNHMKDYRYYEKENIINKSLIRVKSAFGGCGVYRFSSLIKNNCFYREYVDDNNTANVCCEHVFFNSKLKNIFLNRHFLVSGSKEVESVYKHNNDSIISAYKNRFYEFD